MEAFELPSRIVNSYIDTTLPLIAESTLKTTIDALATIKMQFWKRTTKYTQTLKRNPFSAMRECTEDTSLHTPSMKTLEAPETLRNAISADDELPRGN